MNVFVKAIIAIGGVYALAFILVAKPWKDIRFKRFFIPRFLLQSFKGKVVEKRKEKNEGSGVIARPAAMKPFTLFLDHDSNVNNYLLVFKDDTGRERPFLVDSKTFNKYYVGDSGKVYFHKRTFIDFKKNKE